MSAAAAAVREAILDCRGMAGPSGAWVVRGSRVSPDGETTRAYLSTSWGRTEAAARATHRLMLRLGVEQGHYRPEDLWTDDELTFTPVESDPVLYHE